MQCNEWTNKTGLLFPPESWAPSMGEFDITAPSREPGNQSTCPLDCRARSHTTTNALCVMLWTSSHRNIQHETESESLLRLSKRIVTELMLSNERRMGSSVFCWSSRYEWESSTLRDHSTRPVHQLNPHAGLDWINLLIRSVKRWGF